MDETGTTISHMTVNGSGTTDIPLHGVYLIKADIGNKANFQSCLITTSTN